MVLFTAVFFAVVFGALYYYFTRTFHYWKDRNVLGPKPVPFFGNLKNSALRNVYHGEIIRDIYASYPTEKIVGVFRMTTPCLLVRDLDIAQHILIKDFDNFVSRGIQLGKTGLGQNLFQSDGNTWRALRSRFSPIFTNQKLKNMMHLLNDRADKFTDFVHEVVNKTPEQDVHGMVQKYTMSTISACAFGLDIDTLRGDIEELKVIDKKIFTLNFAFELDMMYPGILKNLNIDFFPAQVTRFFKEMVTNVITQRNGIPSTRRDFMDLILEMRNQKEVTKMFNNKEYNLELTDSVIAAQAFIFFAAGYETTASTMGYLLYQLALNPEIQDRVRNEIDEYLKRHDNKIEFDTLKELTYLEQVLDETLRMYPIVETLQRKAETEYKCPGTNVTVAKGQLVFISPLAIHNDEKYYPDPEKFDPDRFTPETVAGRHPCAYIPFGLGPRHCIGIRFAKVQSRVCLIRLLSKVKVEASKNTVRTMSFSPDRLVLSPKNTIYVNFYPRKVL